MSSEITGIFNILATPFDSTGAVDTYSLRNLVNFQISMGAYGLTILGVMGEAAKLTVDERKQVMETVIKTVDKRVPIIVGTSHPQTQVCIDLCKTAFSAGAAGVMIAPPRMDAATDDKVMALYSEIADQISDPIVVQDFPPVNDIMMSPDLIVSISEKIPNANYLKLEDPPLMQKIGAIRERSSTIEIFGGLGGMFLLEELQRGASGTMTGFAFTEILVAVYETYKAGNQARAEAIFDRYLPLIRYENHPHINLSIRKEFLWRRGAISNALLRDPYMPIDAGTQEEIGRILKRTGIEDPTVKLAFA